MLGIKKGNQGEASIDIRSSKKCWLDGPILKDEAIAIREIQRRAEKFKD